MSLNQVRVVGQLMTVNLTATNTSDPADREKWQVADFFGDGVHDATGELSVADSNSADGIYVLDAVNAKRHLVGRGPDTLCACSKDLGTRSSPVASPSRSRRPSKRLRQRSPRSP
jgi:hypothetical protein